MTEKILQVEDKELRLLMRLVTLTNRYDSLYKAAKRAGSDLVLDFARQNKFMYTTYLNFINQLEIKYNIKLNEKLGFKFDIDNLRIVYYDTI